MKKQIMCLSLAAYCGAAFCTNGLQGDIHHRPDRHHYNLSLLGRGRHRIGQCLCHNGKAVMDGQTRLPQIAVIAQDKSPKAQSLRSYWTARPLQ